jgi:hypothetical protein
MNTAGRGGSSPQEWRRLEFGPFVAVVSLVCNLGVSCGGVYQGRLEIYRVFLGLYDVDVVGQEA